MNRLSFKGGAFLLSILIFPTTTVLADSSDDFERAKELLQDGNERQAAQVFLSCAKTGHCGCMNVIAALYYSGQGVSQDYVMSGYWHVRSFETGTLCGPAGAGSAAALGHMLETGEGFQENVNQAKIWYERALKLAKKYNKESCNNDQGQSFIIELQDDIYRIMKKN